MTKRGEWKHISSHTYKTCHQHWLQINFLYTRRELIYNVGLKFQHARTLWKKESQNPTSTYSLQQTQCIIR